MQRALLVLLLVAVWLGGQEVVAQEPAPTRSVPQDSDYVIGPEDVIDVQVWDRPGLSGQRTVDVQGMVQLPLIGEFRAAGRTPAEMSAELTERFQLLDSSISQVLVSMAEYNSESVTVVGEVYQAGRYGFQQIPDLWSVILAAGGPTSDAELGQVQILRTGKDGEEDEAITVDLSGGISASRSRPLPSLKPKDKILVPSVEEIPVGGAKIYVLGAVNDPGIYRVSTAGSIIEAIAAAGGPDAEADLEKVFLTRVGADGTIASKLDLRKYLEEGAPLADLPLQAGDTVTVPQKSSFWSKLGGGLLRIAPFVTSIILATNR